MTDFIQLVISGTAVGAIYALVALGFTLLWQASGTLNFAVGEFVMLPAIMMLVLINMGIPLPLAFLITIVLSSLILGLGFKRVIIDPLLRHGMMPIIVATIGLSLMMRNGVRSAFSSEAHFFPYIFGEHVFNIFGVVVSSTDIGTLVMSLVIVIALQAFLQKTVTGRAMQAVAQNAESATVLGINVKRMVLYTFIINAILACCAALLVTPTYLAKFDMGIILGLKAFLAAIIGGFNNSRGALLGGVLVGIGENLVGAYISPDYKDAVALGLFFIIILFKPNGLLGKVEERKV